jgi:hypothetical protein
LSPFLENSGLVHAGCWFLRSGIQDPSGGVARYYRSDTGQNLAVSNEITGYAASTFAYLYSITEDVAHRDAAARAARFLTHHAWDSAASAFPFEPSSNRAYFFDTGIIIRGLLAAWRCSGEEEFLDRAREAALSLAFDFLGDSEYHPIVALPDKQPLPHEPRWSRRPGCYQLKSALAWHDIAQATGEEHAEKLYQSMLAACLETHRSFLNAEPDREEPPGRERTMDRLHAYAYFLEGLLPAADRDDVRAALADGLARASALRREIAPLFERSDVAAQLLRVRLIAHHLHALDLSEENAREEATRAASFQAPGDHPDVRLRGGFFFGSRHGELLPFSNPVSTAFCTQALQLWSHHQTGSWSFDLRQLI